MSAGFGDAFREASDVQKLALVTAAVERSVTHARLRNMTDAHAREVTIALASRMQRGLLETGGAHKRTYCYLPGSHRPARRRSDSTPLGAPSRAKRAPCRRGRGPCRRRPSARSLMRSRPGCEPRSASRGRSCDERSSRSALGVSCRCPSWHSIAAPLAFRTPTPSATGRCRRSSRDRPDRRPQLSRRHDPNIHRRIRRPHARPAPLHHRELLP